MNQYTSRLKPKIFVNNCTNNKLSFKPWVQDNKNTTKEYHNKHKVAQDKDRLATIPAGEDVICFNCDKPGHYARDYNKPKWDKSHICAAHTAMVDKQDMDDNEQDDQILEHSIQ